MIYSQPKWNCRLLMYTHICSHPLTSCLHRLFSTCPGLHRTYSSPCSHCGRNQVDSHDMCLGFDPLGTYQLDMWLEQRDIWQEDATGQELVQKHTCRYTLSDAWIHRHTHHTQTHFQTHMLWHTHTCVRTRARTHTHMRAHTHTHTHTLFELL